MNPGCIPSAFVSPERPDVTGVSGPLHLSGIVATAAASTSAYVAKDDLAAALAGLEGKIAAILNSMEQGSAMGQGSKKEECSPSPDPPLVEEEG